MIRGINGRIVNGNERIRSGEEAVDNLFLPADRAVVQQMGRARKWLDQGHYSDAIECLDKILESPDDYFYQPDKQAPTHRSLKAEAQRLLGQMPREGRELYELHSGGRAQRMLDEAVAAGDADEVGRRPRGDISTPAPAMKRPSSWASTIWITTCRWPAR